MNEGVLGGLLAGIAIGFIAATVSNTPSVHVTDSPHAIASVTCACPTCPAPVATGDEDPFPQKSRDEIMATKSTPSSKPR